LAAPASAVAAVIVWTVADPVAGVDLDVKTGGNIVHVGIGSIIAVSLVVGILAILVRLGIARATRARVRQLRPKTEVPA